MGLDLNSRTVSRVDGRTLQRQLVDTIRDQIERGALRPGAELPSEGEIAALTGLSRAPVRDALDLLAAEGMIVKRPGARSRVATPPPIRHVATSRYANELAILRKLDGGEHPLTSAFTEDHGIVWDSYGVDSIYTKDMATADDAKRLDIVEGAPVLRRQLVKFVIGGAPVQLQESVIPLALVEGTEVMNPQRQPWPGGTIAELYSVGLTVTRVVEEARARTPTPAERKSLEMQAAGPVWEILRIFYVAPGGVEVPAEASTVIAPAARMILKFETDLRA